MVKNLPANAGDKRDTGLNPGSGRSPGGGRGSPFQYSYLRNPMDRGAWWAIVHRVAQSWTQLKRLSTSWFLQELENMWPIWLFVVKVLPKLLRLRRMNIIFEESERNHGHIFIDLSAVQISWNKISCLGYGWCHVD